MNQDTQIAEGNKAIAEFMGYTHEPEGTLNGIPDMLTHPDRLSLHTNYYEGAFHPKYHTSWDWLMPVVEKIRSIATGDNRFINLLAYKIEMVSHAKCFYCYISKTWWPKTGIHKEEFICGRRDTTNLIDVTWKTIIAFILWYNSSNQK